MIAFTSKESGARSKAHPAKSPLVVGRGATNVAPVATAEFTRAYAIHGDGVFVSAEEGAVYCLDGSLTALTPDACDVCRSSMKKATSGTDRKDGLPQHARRAPARPYIAIEIDGADSEFGGFIAAEHLHTLIERLILVRDRMVADGSVAPQRAR